MTITDEMLREAAPLAAERYLDTLPCREDCKHAFSPEFEAKMRPLLAEKRRCIPWKRFLVLAAIIAALAAGVTVGAVRKPDYRMSLSREGDITYYSFRTDGGKEKVFRPITVGYVPDGWELTQEWSHHTRTGDAYHLRWDSSDGGVFFIYQRVTNRYTSSSNDVCTEVMVSDLPGILLEGGEQDGNALIWSDGNNILEVRGRLPREELLKIAENICS